MNSEKTGEKFGIDLEIALHFARGDEQKLAENLRLFLRNYKNDNMLSVQLFGDNKELVMKRIERIKQDSKLCGAYILYKLCSDILSENDIEVRNIGDISKWIKNAVDFVETYLPGKLKEKDVFEEFLVQLRLAASCRLDQNVKLLMGRLEEVSDTEEKKSMLLKIKKADAECNFDNVVKLINNRNKRYM